MKHHNDENSKLRSYFAITPLIPHFIIIAIAIAAYWYVMTNSLLPEWIDYIYWGLKIIIGFEVLAAAARSFWGPILALIAGLGIVYSAMVYDINLVTTADGWQLAMVALVGFLVTIFVKL